MKEKGTGVHEPKSFTPSKREEKGFRLGRTISISVILIIIFTLSVSAIAIVPAGHRGVVLTFGAVENKVLSEGLHIVTPIAQTVKIMEVRTLKYSASAVSASKDLQDVSAEVALNFHIDAARANEIYQRLGTEYGDRVIAPAIQESVKASTAQFNAEQLITERPTVKTRIEDSLKDRLEQFGIILEILSITDFKFSPRFTSAIESKVVAQQEALQAENILKKIQIEAEQKVATARGEAESIKIINEQLLKSPQYIELLAVQKWNGVLPLATGTGAVPFVNIPLESNIS